MYYKHEKLRKNKSPHLETAGVMLTDDNKYLLNSNVIVIASIKQNDLHVKNEKPDTKGHIPFYLYKVQNMQNNLLC